ncbi:MULTISPECIES: DMT family transporter [unclassified Psychrobacter]|uniref:DMT family transporter n=1 Tax=unclassified Psychrobacter TaxID=196806 RepID=UPI0025B436D5|nr:MULTISPECIES: DMT family transporter [unclassified Psychrobacter]MDN3453001.1 DMT family transporter [Psychrobacter sp. APC 3350]MDN3502980.1 DMT family transporter [Psychrobacter sp. 5A.1]
MSEPTEQQISRDRNTWLIPFACLLTGGALTGISTNLAKYAGDIGLTPLAFLFWSITGAAFILSIVALVRHEPPPFSTRSFEYYFIAALVSVAGSNLLLFSAIPHVGAGFVALTISLPPLLTYLGALALRIETFNVIRASGVATALWGAGVLAVHKFSAPDASIFWILIALCGPMLLAIGNIYRTLRWPDEASPSALAPGMLIAAALLLGLFSMMSDFSIDIPQEGLLPLGLIAVQSCVFAGQFLLLFLLQKTGGPVLLSLLGSVGAIVGVPVAILLQGEQPPEGLFLGATLIAIGVALVTWGGVKIARVAKEDV